MNPEKSHRKFNISFLAIILAILIISWLLEIVNYHRFHATAHILEWISIGVLLIFDAWSVRKINRKIAILILLMAFAAFIDAFLHTLYLGIALDTGLILVVICNYRIYIKPILDEK